MSFDIGSVIAKIDADISGFKKGMAEAEKSASGLGNTLKGIGSGIADFGKQAAIFTGIAGAGMVAFGKVSVDAFNESEAAIAQLNAVLKSTGGVAGVTADQALKLAASLQKTSKFSDEAVLGAENLLLTFTKIGKDKFPQATQTVLDMSQALGQDLKSSSIQLGKALQDPILGVSALRRVGVNFSEKQQDVIKKLVETGHAAQAQDMILKELNAEFGGSAAAAADTFAGKMEILKNRFNDFQEVVGGVLVSVAEFLVTGNQGGLGEALNSLIPDPSTAAAVMNFIVGFRNVLVQLGDWIATHQDLVIMFLKGLAIAIGALMIIGTVSAAITIATNPIFLFIAAVTALYMAWETNFLGIQTITMAVIDGLMAIWNTVFMPMIAFLTAWITTNWTTIKLVTDSIWKIIIGIFQVTSAIIGGIFFTLLALLTGNWKQAWQTIKDAINMAWEGIKNIFNGALGFIRGWGGSLVNELVRPFRDAWNAIQDLVNKIKGALDFTKRHSPSVLDIVKSGVSKVNNALGDLAYGGVINASAAGLAVSRGGDQNSTVVVSIDMDGAFIADQYGAGQMAELLGDSIIKRLQNNVRF
jgi:hypothetical protein